jgi:hypothetical protein
MNLKEEGIELETADSKTIWERVFKSLLFMMKRTSADPQYWIIDGLDEADDPRTIVRLLCDITSSLTPIRLLIVSRRTTEIVTAFEKVPDTLCPTSIKIEDRLDDLRSYIRDELRIPGISEFRDMVVDKIVDGSQNNFLVSALSFSIRVERLYRSNRG